MEQIKLGALKETPESLTQAHYSQTSSIFSDHSFKSTSFFRILMSPIRWILDSVQVVVIALMIFSITYVFAISPHTIEGPSMEPNFCNGDLILADKITPRFKGYNYGDVIVFKHDLSADYIKRIIGKEGDSILVKDGKVYRNGKIIDEPYLPAGRQTYILSNSRMKEGETYKIPEGELIVFGDNRPHSTDSRSFLGIVPMEENTIRGKVIVVLWPFSHMRVFDQNSTQPINECLYSK